MNLSCCFSPQWTPAKIGIFHQISKSDQHHHPILLTADPLSSHWLIAIIASDVGGVIEVEKAPLSIALEDNESFKVDNGKGCRLFFWAPDPSCHRHKKLLSDLFGFTRDAHTFFSKGTRWDLCCRIFIVIEESGKNSQDTISFVVYLEGIKQSTQVKQEKHIYNWSKNNFLWV